MRKLVLDNGVTLLINPNPLFRSVACAFCVLGGLADEKPSDAGVTHLLEHLLFKRTRRRDNREIANVIDRLGGDVNAFTDLDSMCLFGSVPGAKGEELFRFLAELLLECECSTDDLAIEREVIRQEILEAEDNPLDLLYQRLAHAMWPGTIFGYPVFGSIELLERLTLAQVRARLAELTQGSRLVVSIAGNVATDDAVRWAEELLGRMPAGTRPAVAKPVLGSGVVRIERPIRQVHLALAQPWPHVKEARAIPASVISAALGDGSSSRLFQKLRETHGLAYDVGTQIDLAGDSGAMLVSATLDPAAVPRALELILGELREVREHSIDESELDRVREMMIAHLEMEGDRLSSLLWRTIESELNFGRYIDVDEDLAALRSLSSQELAETASEVLQGERIVLGLCGDVAELAGIERFGPETFVRYDSSAGADQADDDFDEEPDADDADSVETGRDE